MKIKSSSRVRTSKTDGWAEIDQHYSIPWAPGWAKYDSFLTSTTQHFSTDVTLELFIGDPLCRFDLEPRHTILFRVQFSGNFRIHNLAARSARLPINQSEVSIQVTCPVLTNYKPVLLSPVLEDGRIFLWTASWTFLWTGFLLWLRVR